MRALYVTGATPMTDVRPAQRLTQVAPDLAMTYVPTVADALAEVRKNSAYQVLFTDPTLPQNETLALIASLRRDRAPLALVPVVAEEQRDFLASAVAAGADDVLLLQGETVLHAAGTLLRIRHSPHLQAADSRPRLRLLYAGRDQLVWTLLEQIPFIKSEKAMLGADGTCVVRIPGADTGRLRCDVVLIDEQPGDAHPLQVIKSVKSQASDLPVVVLTAANDLHTATAALDLGADEAVSKAGIYRRRLIATLRRLHQRVEMEALHSNVAARETRLRNIVERLPAAVTVISDDGRVLAVNNTALALLGVKQPSDLVGREFATLVAQEDRGRLADALEAIRRGLGGSVRVMFTNPDAPARQAELRGVLLERDARGGRGVVAVILPADAPPAEPAGPEIDPEELQALRDRADESARRGMELAQAHEAAREELERTILELDQARAEWAAEREALEARLAAQDTERESIASRLSEAADARDRGAAAAADAEARWHDERSALDARLAEAAHHAETLGDLRRAHETLHTEASQLREAHAELRGELNDARDVTARLRDELAQARESIDRGREQSDASASVQAEWDRARNDWDREREDFTRERESFDRDRENWQRERAAFQHERDAFQSDREQWNHERAEWAQERDRWARAQDERDAGDHQLRAQLAAAEEAARHEREAASRAQAEAHDARSAAAGVEQALAQARAEFAQQLAAIETAHASARTAWDDDRARLLADVEHSAASLEAARRDHEAASQASHSVLAAGGRFATIVATPRGVVVRANDSAARLLGYAGASELVAGATGHPMTGLALHGFDDSRDAGVPVRVSFAWDRRDSGTVHGTGAVRRLDESHEGEPLFEHLVLTVSREVQLEDELRRSRRLEAVGTLASAMVPELESLISAWRQQAGPMHDAEQAAEIVGQLGAFSRHQTVSGSSVDMAAILRGLEPTLRQLAGPQHQLRLDLGAARAVDVSDLEVTQLATALAVFGRELLPAGGSMSIATEMDDEIGTHVLAEHAPMRRPRQARLSVTLRGYGLRPYAGGDAIDTLVSRCGGTIAVSAPAPRTLVLAVSLPGDAHRES